MDELKRELVRYKLSYDIKNNLIEKEVYEYGYSTRFASGYLARLLLSNNKNIIFNYKINDDKFHAYDNANHSFINVRFLEQGYNIIYYFKDNYKYLNECANYFKHYLSDNKVEMNLDTFHLVSTLANIDNILDYCKTNEIDNATYIVYYYFFEARSQLSNVFEKYINSYIKANFNINLQYKVLPISDLLSNINDRNTLDRLEYYDLFPNDLSYEKIFDEIINDNITVCELKNRYHISDRTADIIYREYELYNLPIKQDTEIERLVNTNGYIDGMDEGYIRRLFGYSSKLLSTRICDRYIDRVYYILITYLRNGYYDDEIKFVLDNLNKKGLDADIIKAKRTRLNSFTNNLDLDRYNGNETNKYSLIKKYLKKVSVVGDDLYLDLIPVKNFIRVKAKDEDGKKFNL